MKTFSDNITKATRSSFTARLSWTVVGLLVVITGIAAVIGIVMATYLYPILILPIFLAVITRTIYAGVTGK